MYLNLSMLTKGLPWWLRGQSVCLQCRRPGFHPWVGHIPWRRKWQPTPVFLPGKPHGWRSLVGYSPWSHKESDTTEWLHFILTKGFPNSSVGKESACNAGDPSSIPGLGRYPGEGIGYPLQYSWTSLVAKLVENPPAIRETWVRSLDWEDPL